MKKLSIGNKIISVNAEQLADRSDYFRNLFFGPYNERDNDIIRIGSSNPEITYRVIQALSFDIAFSFKNIPQLIEAIRQVDYFGIDISTNIFEKLDVSPEYYEDLCSLIDILGYEYYLLRSIVYNKPKNYSLSELPITDLREFGKPNSLGALRAEQDHHLYDNYLITYDGIAIKIWSLEENKYIHVIKCNDSPKDIYLSSNKKYLIYRCDDRVIVYDIAAQGINYRYKITLDCICYCAQNNLLCFVKDDMLSIIDANQGCLLHREKIKNRAKIIQLSDKGDMLYVVYDGKIDIYKLEMKKMSNFLSKTRSIIFEEEYRGFHPSLSFPLSYYYRLSRMKISIACSSNRNYLAISYLNRIDDQKCCTKIYDTTNGKLIWEFSAEYFFIETCHFWNDYLILHTVAGIAIYDIGSLRIASEYSIPNSNFFIYHDKIYLLSDDQIVINLLNGEIGECHLNAFRHNSYYRRLPNTKNFIPSLRIIRGYKHNINIGTREHVYFPKSGKK